MYSRSVIDKNLLKASKKLGFSLEYHSIEQVEKMIRHFNELLDDQNKLKRPLRTDEIQFIVNERTLCALDFRYWATRYCWIRDWRGQLVRFSPNIAQNIVLDIWATLEEQGKAISIQQLKARQLGVSTLTELAVAHRVQFYHHTNAVVASSDPEKSAKMAEMMERCWQNQPWWLMPRETKYKSGELIEFGDLNSGVSIQHGTQFSGISRGDTPTVAHLSELCDYTNAEELVDSSLLRAMHESPYMFLVLESTAKGRRNWWHRTWQYSKENWSQGRARLFPMFLPWFVGSDIYPTETWLRSRPIPEEWEPSGITLHHADRAEAYVKSDPILKKYLGEDWQMPVEQMWFWEVTRAEYAAKKELAGFYAEMPADDLECFQSTNIGVFDTDVLSVYRENTTPPLGVFGFIGHQDEFPLRLQPEMRDIDHNLPPINIRAKWNPNGDPFECQLVPLRFSGYANTDPFGKLFVWEFPEENEHYGLGVDLSEGIGADRSTIEAARKGTIERNDAQVAEFASPNLSSVDLWPICMAVGSLYSTKIEGTHRQAKMVIECRWGGENTQLELKKRGWSNFHQWIRYDNKRIRQATANKLGWFTNAWSRPMMMDYLIKSIRDGWVDVNSPWFVDEMADLERDEQEQSMRATYGGHDDRIISLGIVLFSLHILETRGGARSIAAVRSAVREACAVDPVWTPNLQETEEGARGMKDEVLSSLEDRTSLGDNWRV